MTSLTLSRIVHGVSAWGISLIVLLACLVPIQAYAEHLHRQISTILAIMDTNRQLEERYSAALKEQRDQLAAVSTTISSQAISASEQQAHSYLDSRETALTDCMQSSNFTIAGTTGIAATEAGPGLQRYSKTLSFSGDQKDLAKVLGALQQSQFAFSEFEVTRPPNDTSRVIVRISLVSFEMKGADDNV